MANFLVINDQHFGESTTKFLANQWPNFWRINGQFFGEQ